MVLISFLKKPLVMIPHDKYLELQVLEERVNHEPFLCYGDHEPLMLESQLKAQGLAMEEIVEYVSYGPNYKEVYGSMDWVERYMKNINTLWDVGSEVISGVIDTVVPTGYRMV
jgi:hypothetical protein